MDSQYKELLEKLNAGEPALTTTTPPEQRATWCYVSQAFVNAVKKRCEKRKKKSQQRTIDDYDDDDSSKSKDANASCGVQHLLRV